MILDYLQKFGEAKRSDFEKIVLDKLPEFLDIKQKKDKVKNNLQILKKAHKIDNKGKLWKMSNE
jgi:ATP-dependent DNA helicase RecG